MPPKDSAARRSQRKKQTRLVFDPVAPSSSTQPISKSSPAKVRYQLPANGNSSIRDYTIPILPSPAKTARRPVGPTQDSEDDDDSDIIPQSSRRVRNSSPPMTKPFDFDPLEDDTVPVLARRPARARGNLDGYEGVSDSSDGSLPEEPVALGKKKQKTPVKKKAVVIESDDDESKSESESESEPELPKLRTPRSFIQGGSSYNAPIPLRSPGIRQGTQKSSSASKPSSAKSRRQKSITLSDSEDELASSARVTRSQPRIVKPAKPLGIRTSLEEEEEEDDIIMTSPTKRRQRTIIVADDDDDQSDASEVIISPLKRRRQTSTGDDEPPSRGASPTKRRRAEKVQTPPRKTRQQRPKKRTAKEKTMELLKRKRAGEKIEELTPSDSENEEDGALYDTESDLQVLSEFEDEPEDEAPIKAKKKSKKRLKSGEENDEDDEDDWIVDDDEDNIGVPLGLHDIPLEFTHNSHKPLKEHFKDAIEWMIHNKINPAFPRDDPIYRTAFRKLDDEVRGYANSKYVSSVWREGFSKALWARPIFLERDLGIAEPGMKCNACNRSGHPPSYVIQLQGKAYSKETLEEIELDSDSEDGSDSDSSGKVKSVDSKGNVLPAEDEEFYLGRFCASNARIAHSLIHWKHELNEWVLEHLKQQGFLTPAQLAQRDKMKSKARKKLAYSIVDDWAADGSIKNLYGDFKRSLETAREGPQDRWGKK
ncbi:hypothetical protein PVAG01_04965 [Phlyctema vagabunda]|uniref:DUF4211 domain-containing protein n=1 Tax=Phlyctema vagabunda TaxID=108571 RepID=A0ABR4PJ23_9HELO